MRNDLEASGAHEVEGQVRTQTTMRVLRERAGLTQTELARLLDRAQPEVSMWEWGKERMPDAIREQVYAILRRQLRGNVILTSIVFTSEDLDRAWDDVLTRTSRPGASP